MGAKDDGEGWSVVRLSAPAWTTRRACLEAAPVEGDRLQVDLEVVAVGPARDLRAQVHLSRDDGHTWRTAVEVAAFGPGSMRHQVDEVGAGIWRATVVLSAGATPAECQLRVRRKLSNR